MASKYWLKLYHEMLDDPKIGQLRAALRWRFVECLLVAGECDDGGYLPSIKQYAWRVRADAETVETDFVTLADAGLLSQDDGQWLVTKFAERQAKVSDAERMARYRERKRKAEYYEDDTQPLPGSYDGVTKRNTDIDIDIDKEKIQKKKRVSGTGPLPDIPESLATPEFMNAWGEYRQHRKEIRKKLTPLAAKRQLNTLDPLGPDRAAAAIYHSIANGWTGIFEDKAAQNGQHKAPEPERKGGIY